MTRLIALLLVLVFFANQAFAHGGGGGGHSGGYSRGWNGDVPGGRDYIKLNRPSFRGDPSAPGLGYVGGGGWDTMPRRVVRPAIPATPDRAPRVKAYNRNSMLLLPTYNPKALFRPNNEA